MGICRVLFDAQGDPTGVERLGIALEPEAPYESAPGLGCEDPRVVFVEPLDAYVMTYVAVGPDLHCPRVALAWSDDLLHWRRLGTACFASTHGLDCTGIPNKNAIIFPDAVRDPSGNLALAMIHRPLLSDVGMDLLAAVKSADGGEISRDTLWVSYSPLERRDGGEVRIGAFTEHHRLPLPKMPWSRLRIGGGTPPIRTHSGYLVFYHGVSEITIGWNGTTERRLVYSAGAMMLDEHDVRVVTHHTAEAMLTPTVADEVDGFVPRVVFPTGADRRTDIGQPNRFDVYYGMADQHVGVARVDVKL